MSRSDDNPDQLVPVVDCSNELEGQELRSVIEDAGIPAFVLETETLGIGLGRTDARLGGVQVKVARSNRERAREALELSRIQSARIDWDEVDVGEAPPEVLNVLDNRPLVHNTRRVVTLLGPILGIGFLLLAIAGIVLFLVF